MKKITAIFISCVCILALVACGNPKKEDILNLGVNAVITKIDTINKTITVKDCDDKGILGKECNIDCSKVPMIYCEYDTGELKTISFEDLQVNDEIIFGIRSSEIEKIKSSGDDKIKVEQIQLGTQRLNNN